jgi:hypothetical protein
MPEATRTPSRAVPIDRRLHHRPGVGRRVGAAGNHRGIVDIEVVQFRGVAAGQRQPRPRPGQGPGGHSA